MKKTLVAFCILVGFHFASFGQHETGFLELDDAKIYYKIFGKKGDYLLLINGGPGFSSNYLNDVAKDLSKYKRRVVLYDQRGTGKSSVKVYNKKVINISKNLNDIDSLRTMLGVKKLDIIGHAYGSALAMTYAYKNPKKVNKIALTSTIGLNLDFVEPMMANLEVRLTGHQQDALNDSPKNDEETKQRFDLVADAYVFDKKNVDVARKMHQEYRDFVREVNTILWTELQHRDYDITKYVKDYKGEVLIMHGRQDVIGESVPFLTHLALPNSELIYINKAGRYLWLDQPDDYFYYLNEFFN